MLNDQCLKLKRSEQREGLSLGLGFGFWVLGFDSIGVFIFSLLTWVLTFRGITNAEGKVFSRVSRRDAAKGRAERGANRVRSIRKTLLLRVPTKWAIVFAG